jgi:CDGSH-type Zn-finger protein
VTANRVQVVPGGPVLVPGPVRIEMPGGEVVESDRFMVAICTCRRSGRYPLCDASHRRCRPGKSKDRKAIPAAAVATTDPASRTP